MSKATESIDRRRIVAPLPPWLRRHLATLHRELGGELYLAGGAVRDLLVGDIPADIDLTVASGAQLWAARLAALTGGALVPLGRGEDAARVVSGGVSIDFSSFRQGAQTIIAELRLRDLTINALAVRLDPLLDGDGHNELVTLIDPTGGLADLRHGMIRAAGAASFCDDPLRLLRVYRFAATLGWPVDPGTTALVRRQRELLAASAPERIAHELDLIMASGRGHAAVSGMAETGLLWACLPELAAGVGVEQPKSHHLDVWNHNLETLRWMERLVIAPDRWFGDCGQQMASYVARPNQSRRLAWAALLHDLGKPATFAVRRDKGDRITFYNHDRVGAELFAALAGRLRWSNEERTRVAHLIGAHMRPFHLANVFRAGGLTLRAAIRMIRAAGNDLPGLFLLAMADSLAGQGVERVVDMERELAELYRHVEQVRRDHVQPVQTAPPLLTGTDLIETLHLAPGPLFRQILAAVEEARMAGEVEDLDGALRLARVMAAECAGLAGEKWR